MTKFRTMLVTLAVAALASAAAALALPLEERAVHGEVRGPGLDEGRRQHRDHLGHRHRHRHPDRQGQADRHRHRRLEPAAVRPLRRPGKLTGVAATTITFKVLDQLAGLR